MTPSPHPDGVSQARERIAVLIGFHELAQQTATDDYHGLVAADLRLLLDGVSQSDTGSLAGATSVNKLTAEDVIAYFDAHIDGIADSTDAFYIAAAVHLLSHPSPSPALPEGESVSLPLALVNEVRACLEHACERFQGVDKHRRQLGPLPLVSAAHEYAETVLCKLAPYAAGQPLPPPPAAGQDLSEVSGEGDDAALGQVIDERDAAEEALSEAFQIVTGRSPEWSNLFGHREALEEIGDACYLLRQAASPPPPTLPDLEGVKEALRLTQRLIDEALPKFDWGKSALDANAIRLLNETPGAVRAALQALEAKDV